MPDELASLTLIIVSAIDNIRNIKCKHPDINEIYRYVSRTVATNVGTVFIETTVAELVNKNLISNKPTAEGLDSYFIFIINAKENSEVMNSATANKNLNSNSNITSDINKSSSKTPNETHDVTIEKENAIQNSASTNEKLSSNSSIIYNKNPTNSENTPLKNWADFSLNGKEIWNSAEILEKIVPSFLGNVNTPILVKYGQLNTELQALKNCILKIEAQMSALKSHVKCELSSLANKIETMSLYL